jgi:hypothetical protein
LVFPPEEDTDSDGTNRGEQRNEQLHPYSFRRFDAIAEPGQPVTATGIGANSRPV